MKIFLTSLIVVAAAAVWLSGKNASVRLRAQLETLRTEQAQLERLRAEQARLKSLQPSTAEQEYLGRAATEHAQLRRELASREADAQRAQNEPLPLAEWTSAHIWKHRGQATPRATVETALWAAAGGDVDTLQRMLAIEPAARAKAEALLERLPAASRAAFPSAEKLIASLTAKRVPLGEAQLVWLNQPEENEAAACVFLHHPDPAPGSLAPNRPAGTKGDPRLEAPTLTEKGKTGMAFLAMRRVNDQWRLVVPPSAIDSMARELIGAK